MVLSEGMLKVTNDHISVVKDFFLLFQNVRHFDDAINSHINLFKYVNGVSL